ncbi:MAG: hypothetical protein JW795_14835 [Chitinivibrionales bacterium]|nr:hypothetical protein [Chitinivibrionales bacterium]
MNQVALYYGICLTCVSASLCRNAKNNNRPVIQCEEFDDGSLALCDDEKYLSESSRAAYTATGRNDHINFSTHGLCGNCQQHESCCLQKKPGAVLQCELYE